MQLRLNGVAQTLTYNVSATATGNFANAALNIGSRNNGTALLLDGRIYSLIVRGATSSAAEIDSAEDWVAAKTGVTLP